MPRTISIHDRAHLLEALGEHRAMHVYAIGDLDGFFFPFTSWFALEEGGRIRQIVLLYSAGAMPVVLAIAPRDPGEMGELMRSLLPVLPRRFYMHATPGVSEVLARDYELRPHGLHHKMALVDPRRLDAVDTSGAVPLVGADLPEIEAFYAAAYPGNWFDPRMLGTGRYVGARVDGVLVSVAGVHVFSPTYRVAALGNIATRGELRGRGLGAVVTASLCRALARDCDTIGLNVHAENRGAIRLYERLGFAVCGSYEELEVVARPLHEV